MTPLAQHLSRTRPTSPLRCVTSLQTQMHPCTPTLSGRHRSSNNITICVHFFCFLIHLIMSRFIAENSKTGMCFLPGLNVLAVLSYDTLVVNRSRGPYTHQGQSHLTTLYLPNSTFPKNFRSFARSPLTLDSAAPRTVFILYCFGKLHIIISHH